MSDTTNLSLRLPASTVEDIRAEADRRGRTVNNLASWVLRRFATRARAKRDQAEVP